MSSTSSESLESDTSEDEEEVRKISEAVGGVFNLSQRPQSPSMKLTTGKSGINQSKVPCDANGLPLKSNRPQPFNENDDNDDDKLLQTTPEFRNYVAKQLSQLLDGQLATQIESGSWDVPSWIEELFKEHGIKLLSNSTSRLRLDNPAKAHEDVAPSSQGKIPRKRVRMSTPSSESSDEEDAIAACVVTPQSIEEENQRLAQFEVNKHPDVRRLGRLADCTFVAAKDLKNTARSKTEVSSQSQNRISLSSTNLNLEKTNAIKKRSKKKKRKKEELSQQEKNSLRSRTEDSASNKTETPVDNDNVYIGSNRLNRHSVGSSHSDDNPATRMNGNEMKAQPLNGKGNQGNGNSSLKGDVERVVTPDGEGNVKRPKKKKNKKISQVIK